MEVTIPNCYFHDLGYIRAVANLKEKHDRSTPTDYHWKILKCRMLIFSNNKILSCPDQNDVKRIHIIFRQSGDEFDKINSLFMKFSLMQDGDIRKVTPEIYQSCFYYTLTAKLAPSWNILGNYLINNRNFLTATGPQDGIVCEIKCNDHNMKISLKPLKITMMPMNEKLHPGEWIRVLPSLNKAIVDDLSDTLPETAYFKSYKDLRRHWKNIHGYRLAEEEGSYCLIRFWRGEPLTYPRWCVRQHPIVIPVCRNDGVIIMNRFLECFNQKMSQIIEKDINISPGHDYRTTQENTLRSQAVSLCTPTQQNTKY